ncbi:prolipoprotein diacylglyceryl transferase [bacterium]|nr:prolipoprotein diacylglyceryl transferase [bacterium]
MHPFLDLGFIQVPTYGIFLSTAILVGWMLFLRLAKRDGIDGDKAGAAAFWALVAGVVGGKVGLILVDLPIYLSQPQEIFTVGFLRAAGVVWTAVLAGAAAFAWTARRGKLPMGRLVDAAALPVPICQAIGRIGCLMAGCCYGGRCDLPWGIVYESQEAHLRTGVPLGVSLHPAPMYEALWSLAVVLPLLVLVRRRRRAPGEVVLAYFGLYALGRFVVEFFRGDDLRGVWFGGAVSTSQLISLAVFPLALAAWIYLRRRAPQAAPVPATSAAAPAAPKSAKPPKSGKRNG